MRQLQLTYVIDSVDVRLGKDKFLESLTEAVPRGLMYRRVTVLHVPDTHTPLQPETCQRQLDHLQKANKDKS